MKTISATELKTKTSDALNIAQREHVAIEKNGRAIAVLVSQADYERFISFEDQYWMSRVEAAEQSGFIGAEETAEFFKAMLKGNAES